MFKNLKKKISEEQSPQRNVVGTNRQQQGLPPSGNRSRTSSLTGQQDDGSSTPDKELLAGMIAEPAFLSEYTIFAVEDPKRPKPQTGSAVVSKSPLPTSPDAINGNESQRNDQQSFTQKLQLRVPSMESLFRSPVKETLFRSPSKESLVRSGSRDSLNRIDSDGPATTFDPPSDIESEAEESSTNLEGLTKEQLFQRLRRMERSLGNYRGKYSELVTTYRIVQREREKLQSILSQSQDKALRRISELREELQMDQQAKKHLQEEFDASLEEKDQLITVLQTQVSLLKQRLGSSQANTDLPEQTVESDSQTQNLTQEINSENAFVPGDGSGDTVKTLESLQVRVRRQENLLQRCKEMIRSHKERNAQLSSEKETLQEQLEERLQELEKMKELHTNEKTKLITQLRDAKNLIEQLEQDKGMVIAETKRQMHETLEMKEEEVTQLRVRLKQLTTQCDELREQKEKSEKAAFEELEKALHTTQKTEEARKKGKVQMDEQIKAIEKASEDERKNLQQELSRVKQEVVDIMKKSSEERIAKLEQLHAEELARKEQELKDRLQTQEQQFAEQMKAALVKSHEEFLNTVQAKEQDCLALEELELQKKAIQSQSENRLQELQQETDMLRTRILELESSLAKSSEEAKQQGDDLAANIESERNKHNSELTHIEDKHRKELEKLRQEFDQTCSEKLQLLKQEHEFKMEELRDKLQKEQDDLLKEKETIFHAHIEEMNVRTLEKLDVKQTELETLSAELSEALKARQELEQQLAVFHDERKNMVEEWERNLEQEIARHKEQIEDFKKEKEISAGALESALKAEVQSLELQLTEKQKQLEELQAQEQVLNEIAKKSEAEVILLSAKLEDACQSHQNNTNAQVQLYEAQLAELKQKITNVETERAQLIDKEAATESQLNVISAELSSFKAQVTDLKQQLEEQSENIMQKLSCSTQEHESEMKHLTETIEHAKKDVAERENEIAQIKMQQNQQMEDFKEKLLAAEKRIRTLQDDYESKLKNQESKFENFKQKTKEIQETLKRKLSEQEKKFKMEIENKQLELSEKEKHFNAKMLEMAQAGSTGISDAVSQLDHNHKEQLKSMSEAHRREIEEIAKGWEKKLQQHVEELQEKHEHELQEKEQEVTEVKQKLDIFGSEKDEASREIAQLKEEQGKKDLSFNELQEQLKQVCTQVDTLLHDEARFKSKVETLEADLNRTLSEKSALQDQLGEVIAAAAKDSSRVNELVEMLKEANEKLETLESLHTRDCEDYEKRLKDKFVAAQQKETEFNELLLDCSSHLKAYCTDIDASLKTKNNELNAKCSDKINLLIARMTQCQNQIIKIKEAVVVKAGKIVDLETQLDQVTSQHASLESSLQHSMQHLQDKEKEISLLREELHCLKTEKESLQKEGGQHQEVVVEKEGFITQLKKELSEKMNAVTSLQGELRGRESKIEALNVLVSELKTNLENSIGVAEKEAATSALRKQSEEDLMSRVETLSHEKASALEQVDQHKNKLAEWKKKAENRFTQNHNTIKELQAKLDMHNQQSNQKDEQLRKLKEELDKQSKSLDSLKAEAQQMQIVKEKKECSVTAELEAKKARIEELEGFISKVTREKECLVEEMRKQSYQKEAEHKELVQQLQNAQVTVFEKDNRYMEAEQKVLIFEKDIATLKTELETRQRDFDLLKAEIVKSKEEEVKALETKLAESIVRHTELKKKAEQKIAAVKKQLLSQVEEKEQCKKDLDNQLQDLKQKMQERENRVKTLEVKIKSIEDSSGFEKEEMQREVQNVKAAIEQEKASTLENVRQMYEEKISSLQKDIVEKEQQLQKQREKLEEKHESETKMQSTYDDLLQKLERIEKERQRQQATVGRLQKELEACRKQHDLLLNQHKEKEVELLSLKQSLQLKETEMQEMGSKVDDLKKTLNAGELTMKEKDETLAKDQEMHRLQIEESTLKHNETLKALQEQLEKKDDLIKTFEENVAEKVKSDSEIQTLLGDMQSQLKELNVKLKEAEKEKQKLCKDLASAQKDLRVLRKEQQQELEILKKELADEADQKIKHEQEDMELKHNSKIKQLMREFNTQMAKKERELETAVQETISKAQEVEAELMQSHQIEATQLHKRIVEKDDDLKRTVTKYEEILEAREEEMTAKVAELQAQLEELQTQYAQKVAEQENRSADGVTTDDLQTQLSEKTTLLNEARLKEQEFREQIHTLADQLRQYERNVFVTPLGTPYREGSHRQTDVSAFGEPTEFEYLRKVMYEYMMGKETKTMAKVITTVLRFPPDQTQKILEREEARPLSWLRTST
ncbi:golgin subfamily A member 4 isoform X2 [Pleurodeles waltl]|uniref:golgin subfamily A member 4 isoform X2 n=1 Tax=Pleurodeles waltl TaxID=8319 RepID=UPI00370944DC